MEQAFIPLSVPNLKGNELAYVTKAVETEWVSTGGPYVNEFEKVIAEYAHVPGAVSCQNGTSGIHTALLLAGVWPGPFRSCRLHPPDQHHSRPDSAPG